MINTANSWLKLHFIRRVCSVHSQAILNSASSVFEFLTTGLTNSNWKVRLEAVQNFSAKVEGFEKNVNVQALIQILGRKPGWKDNNAQVSLFLNVLLFYIFPGLFRGSIMLTELINIKV